MVHTLFLTDSRNFNPAKYMAYTVIDFYLCHIFENEKVGKEKCNIKLMSRIIINVLLITMMKIMIFRK